MLAELTERCNSHGVSVEKSLGLVTEIERPTRGTGSNGLTMFVSASKPFLDVIKRGSEYTHPHDPRLICILH